MAKIIRITPVTFKTVETFRGGTLVQHGGYTYIVCSAQDSKMKAINIESGNFLGKGTLVNPVPAGEVITLIADEPELRG
jgi:hypothetical protein